MKDPASITAAAAVGLTATGLGHVLGFAVDALLLGLCGGVVAILVLPPPTAPVRNPLGRAMALAGYVMAAVLAAAGLAPITAALLHATDVDRLTELRAYSFLWGAGVTVLLPTAISALRNRIRQAGGLPATEDRPDDTP